MGCPVNIGILMLVKLGKTIYDRLRLLGCCSIVEPDQRLAMYMLAQDRKVAFNRRCIERAISTRGSGNELWTQILANKRQIGLAGTSRNQIGRAMRRWIGSARHR